jgi:hypothetical protein
MHPGDFTRYSILGGLIGTATAGFLNQNPAVKPAGFSDFFL